MGKDQCNYCENAIYVGEIHGMKAFICSRTGNINDDCDMYDEGTPRDGRIILTSHIDFEKIRSGIGTLTNRGDEDGKE